MKYNDLKNPVRKKPNGFLMKTVLMIALLSVTILLSACGNNEEKYMPDEGAKDVTDTSDNNPSTDVNKDTDSADTENEDTASTNTDFDTSQEVTTPEGCYDSDGGSFDKIKGFIIDLNKAKFVDECVNQYSVREYYCGITGYKMDKIVNCKFECQDGVCVEGEASTNCVDSDFYDEFTKGTTTYKGDIKTDYCESDKLLIEQICSNLDIASTKEIVCDGGCTDGRCIKVVPVDDSSDCTDPDQGPDAAFTKTTVVDKKGSFTDECLNQYEVKEYYCNSYGFHADKNIRCDNGCEDGICY